MSAEYATRYYVDRPTYGNVAYDLGRVRPEYEVPEQERQERKQVREQTAAKPRRQVKEAHGVSLFAIAGFAVTAVLMIFVLLSNVRLTEISASASQTRTQIAELEKEQGQLEVAYETTFNLSEIRAYAIEHLGMTESSNEQTVALGSAKADKAVIYDTGTAQSGGIIATVTTFFTSLMEYFK